MLFLYFARAGCAAWSESTPMARALAPAAASIAPLPEEAGGGVDDVGLLVELALRGFLALVGGGEAGEVRRGGQVGDLDRHVRVDGLDARAVTGLELLDQLGLHTADEAHVLGLRLEGGGDTGEVGALLLGERQRGDVARLGVRRRVDDRELGVRVLLGDLLDGRLVDEADRDDRVVTGGHQVLETGLLVGLGLAGLGVGLGDGDAELGLGLVETAGGGVVERLVATAADVVGHTDLQRTVGGAGGGGSVIALCAACGERGDAQGTREHNRSELGRTAQGNISFSHAPV